MRTDARHALDRGRRLSNLALLEKEVDASPWPRLHAARATQGPLAAKAAAENIEEAVEAITISYGPPFP
jgi:hypothetical protein